MDSSEYICKFTEEEKSLAKMELNETDEKRTRGIEEIRQWILNTPDIVSRTGICWSEQETTEYS